MTKPVHWRTQVCDFNTNYISKVENELPELKAPRTVTWNFHVDNLHGIHRYSIKLGREIFYELNIELCSFNINIRGNGDPTIGNKDGKN